VDAGKLEAAVRALVYRHDTLRMSFHMHHEPACRVHSEVNMAWHYTTCRDTDVNDMLRALVKPFDIAGAGLFRASLVQVNGSYHLLLLDFHHIISDGLSVQYFLHELFALYTGDQLLPVAWQYKDYVAWEKQWHQSEKIQLQKTYWLQQLQHDLPVLEMPVDKQRPAIFSTAGRKLFFTIDEPTTVKLRQLAQANNCTLHVLMFTLYNVLLSKYTGQQDIVVGIPVAGRSQVAFQPMQGMFVNNLAIRSNIAGELFFTALLQQQQTLLASALQNQDYPFDQLIGDLAIKRDVSRNPVFDTMFMFHTVVLPQPAAFGVHISRYNFDPGIAKFDLSMEMLEEGNLLHYAIEYATGLFNQPTIERFGSHFAVLINHILEKPHGRVKDYRVMSEEEYTTQVKDFNATECNYPRNKTIHELFEEQVSRTPAHIALVYGTQQMTYTELDERATTMAGYLRKKGIVPNTVVGLLLKRSPRLMVSILAVLKAGGCYLPIDTGMPAARINLLMADSRCQLIISDNGSIGDYHPTHAGSPEVLLLDREEHAFSNDGAWPFISTPGNLAYIIYTSGTTGTPKGVMISHRSLVNYIGWAAEKYIQNENCAFPLFTSIAFDLTVTSIFTPLLTGNTIVIYDDSDKEVLIEKIVSDNRVEVIKLTPAHLKIMASGVAPVAGSKIKRFIVGGEQLEARVAKQVYEKFSGAVEIYNEYGPTEATVGCMICKYDPANHLVNVPIGVPAHNTKIYILDQYLQPVPAGVKGELYIAGDGLAKGYLFNQALTQQKFIPDPFNEGKKMYKTGDIARRLPGNIIEYTGRRDEQVKINGFRIELPEIVHHLVQVPGIAEAVAAVKTNAHNRKNLYAWYTAPSGKLNEPDINNRLALVLPHYMLPVRYIHIAHIPLTKNGKIAYEALPLPHDDMPAEENSQVPGATELVMLQVWDAILNEPAITVFDNFFELGGDSIKAVQIVARLLDQGITVSVKDILTYHTIRQISRRAVVTDHRTRYNQGSATGVKDLTPIEKWFFGHHFANPAYYNQSVLLAFNKEINLALLQQAWRVIIEHHDGLRLNYDPAQASLFYNNSLLHQDFYIPVYAGLSPEAEAQLLQQCRNFGDLNGRLLLRALMLKDKGSFGSLFITMHHLVTDGVSWRIVLEDLYAVYTELEAGRPVSLPPKTASLTEWTNELYRWAASAAFEPEKDYWKKIDDCTAAIPVDEETGDWHVANSSRMSAGLDADRTLFLTREANDVYKTNVPVLLITALALTVKEWTGMPECVIEQEGHGREAVDIDVSRTVGWFTALYPVHLRLNETGTGAQIREIKEQLKKIPGGGVGYGWYRYGSHTTHHHTAPVPIRFNYLGRFGSELNNGLFSFAGNPAGFESDPANCITARIECNAMIIDGRLLIDVYYNAKAHKDTTIQWLVHTFLANLDTILDHLKNEKDIHFTPSDFDCVHLDQEELDALF
jgi:surfactin family lipopeptide synthetase A